eukprot:TRINITY_DN1782_c0_g1_i3.p1 TRINITY_DN1782_c0_g1~~TRINITY_DN1782_c0_g1_i3.p1  ORF type:complete len:453 (+),score=130.84 TRINITY_DN1782_c0_g1_i3:1-1359(+)
MPDGLHPSALGHRDLVLPQLREAMDKSLLAAAAAAPSVAAPDPPEGNWGPCVEQCDRPPGWFDLAALLDREAAAAAAAAEGDPAAPRPVVFLGDSIFEAFRGTHVGAACGPCAGTPRVFRDAVAPYGAPAAQGIAGDQTGHLLHRLRQPGLRRLLRAAATAVVHIGTNDLTQMVRGGAVDGDALARRVAAVVSGVQAELGKSGAAPPLVVVVGLLPRSSGNGSPAAWPNDAYTPPILDTNARLREAYAADPAVTVVDCVPAFEAVAERGVIPARFMPDGLHPSALGHRDLVLPQLREAMDKSLLAAAAAAPSVAAPDPPEGNWGPCVEQCDRPPGWFDLAALLDREAAAAAAAAEGDPAAPRPVVFLGDSIFEAFRGTHVGAACGPCAGTPRVFRDAVAPYGAPAAQGIAGDQTGHLLHRLRQPGLRRLLALGHRDLVLAQVRPVLERRAKP